MDCFSCALHILVRFTSSPQMTRRCIEMANINHGVTWQKKHIQTTQISRNWNEKREYAESCSIQTLCDFTTASKKKTITILYSICKCDYFICLSLHLFSSFVHFLGQERLGNSSDKKFEINLSFFFCVCVFIFLSWTFVCSVVSLRFIGSFCWR